MSNDFIYKFNTNDPLSGTINNNVNLQYPVNIDGTGINFTNSEADIVFNGKSLRKAIENIEDRLSLMTPNPEIEKEWEELRELGRQYRKLEEEIKQKIKVWEILKS
jgi:hypothetical protein